MLTNFIRKINVIFIINNLVVSNICVTHILTATNRAHNIPIYNKFAREDTFLFCRLAMFIPVMSIVSL